ncbi:unnamed protein product [Mytilus coruscus]|uniref:Uncharacterized protein n=1 Tax=Mytilus coruscus TaxID=42192 RepID=A0A6J8BL75_MYTCO|nr:unnamed protein product [Mytilus coruscus]
MKKREISVVAGSGLTGRKYGPCLASFFTQPSGIAAEDKTLYVCDSGELSVLMVTPRKGMVKFLTAVVCTELMKKTTSLPYLYFTNQDSYYERPEELVPFKAVVKMPKIKEIKITQADRTLLDDYRKKYLQSVKQLSIRQQNTKFKAGTLPLYAYQKETQSVDDTIDFEKLLIDEKETGEQAFLIMFPTGTLLLLSVEVWNLINDKKERRVCDFIICKTTIETPVGSDDVLGDMFVNSPGNPFICKTINCITISIDHVVKELNLNSQINVKSNQISISELLYEELIGRPQNKNSSGDEQDEDINAVMGITQSSRTRQRRTPSFLKDYFA